MVAERASMSRRNMTPVDPADVEQHNGNGNGNGNGHNGTSNGHARNGHRSPGTAATGQRFAHGGPVGERALAANGGTGSTPRRRRRAED